MKLTNLTSLRIFHIAIHLLLYCSASSATTVLGVVGGKASIGCDISPPTPDDGVSLILWYKDESTTPIYSLDARKGLLDQARHAANDNLATRSYFSTIEKNAHLLIENVVEDDAGEYRCRVDYRKARTRNFMVNLKVITPPEKPVIKDASDEVLSTLIGPFNEGERLVLGCEVQGGKPRPSVTWWRESVLLDDTYEVTAKGTTRNDLEIPSLQRHDLMAVFTCQASNNNISAPVSSQVTVDLNFRPLVVSIEPGNKKWFSAEKQSEVVCKAAGSRPPATVTWWKGSKQIKRNREKVSVDGNVTTSIVSFTPTADDNGKYLSCRAENQLIVGSAVEDGITLEVHYIPQLALRLGSKLRHSHIQEGNDVYFECNIRSNPWVTEVRWWFEGKEIQTNTSAGVIVSNQSLVLQRVQRKYRGRYTCSASNAEGEGESNSVHLRVQYSPVCRSSQKILYGAARHEQVKVLCEVDADPADVTFHWAFNNSNENIEVANFVTEGLTSVATYVPRTEFDYGTLYCWARNSVGPQVEPCVFTIIPAGSPDPVKNCSVINQTEDSVRVDCMEGYDGGLLQHFIMEVRDASAERLRANITNSWPSFTARGLPPGSGYLLVIYSANAKGRSKAVVITASTLALPESMNRMANGTVWQLSFSPLLALLIAIVLVLVIIAFVIVIIMKFRTTSHRIRKARDKKRLGEDGDKSETPLRKGSHEDVSDICTCGADSVEDKCQMEPDIIPEMSLGSQEAIALNGDLVTSNGGQGLVGCDLNGATHVTLISESCFSTGVTDIHRSTPVSLHHWRTSGPTTSSPTMSNASSTLLGPGNYHSHHHHQPQLQQQQHHRWPIPDHHHHHHHHPDQQIHHDQHVLYKGNVV
ncbi:Neural cell adhesion molecule 2 [Halotydeus destructor]|nr:Neural cell adhesion molecule 2 [Halotydeus destructor]